MLSKAAQAFTFRVIPNVSTNHQISLFSSSSRHGLHHSIRALLRETAQPVAVVTSFMPQEHRQHEGRKHEGIGATGSKDTSIFHGATLSSFTSISMDPHPLIAFSLRVPSRMATTLSELTLSDPAHMVISLLSAPQAHHALLFSRPDLHPHPFDAVRWSTSKEGFPILHGSLGALSCRLITSTPLHSLNKLDRPRKSDGTDDVWKGEGVASKLFIAQVVRVENVLPDSAAKDLDPELWTKPLLYHRRGYATISNTPLSASHKHGH
ncbi:hypothetical protein EVG20_g3624 [Dentipellis fragilis]|uniref:Flavin reductase like domain-containing protein n=1 Tax=Dentipellis fragilis TaxID=205917 RepID=A0A4Y9Z0E1_9AGAM|nr:hypothetical protein EVG20_g3624 [Dentipellis fragilis]